MHSYVRPVFLFVVGTLSFAPGCGNAPPPPVACAVHGKVLQGGRPLQGGTIEFQKLDEPRWPTEGAIKSDGTFTLSITRDGKRVDGAAPGEYRVVVLFAKNGDEPPSPPTTLAKTYKVVAGENSITLEIPP